MRTWIGVLVALCLAVTVSAETLTYVDILNQLTDFDRLTRLQTGIKGGQYSSYARQESEQWAFNADAGQYIRVEDSGGAVMMEQEGPGCVFRMWSANPKGKLHIYIDGATEPIVLDHHGIFLGDTEPFIEPLVYKRTDEAMSASDAYVPISFAKSIKICADEKHPQFYIFGYLQYPDDWDVESFHLPLTDAENAALRRAADAWSEPGVDPKPTLQGQKMKARTVTLKPGQTVNLAKLKGPGTVRAIRAKVDCTGRDYWRKLVLKASWDGSDWPQVETPLGALFGFDWTTPEYGSLPAGCLDGEGYLYYAMPFRESGVLELTSYLEMPATVTYEIEYAKHELPEDTAYFFARWRHEVDSATLDYPFIETAGNGHLVGISLQIDHPIPGWWGEGDEKVWIDGDQFPEWIGTGSEDYFGDAWGIRYLPGPSFGCSYDEYPKTCPYRWHFMDFIPFERRLRMTIENYGSWSDLDANEYEYNSVAYWYQEELVPPFEDLAGRTYIGGEEYLQEPAEYQYQTDRFPEITADDVLTSGLDLPYAVEAEHVIASGNVITDAKLAYQFNWERAVDFGEVEAGQELAEFELVAADAGVHYPTLYTAPEEGLAELSLEVDGRGLAVVNQPETHIAELDGVDMPAGGRRAKLIAATAGRAVIDCFQLRPAPATKDAIEAETLEIVSATGAEPEVSAPMRGPSEGQILEWPATAEGDALVLALPERELPALVLHVRPMQGPDEGIIQAFAEGEPIGPRFDLYAPTPARQLWMNLPLGTLPAGSNEVEIRVVGKNPAASSYHVGLDYFKWAPLILHPDSVEGAWARLARNQSCGFTHQALGPAFVGGHQFWVQPCLHGGFVELAVHLPEEGDYEVETRLTTSWDYAIVQMTMDGEPLGEPVDTLTETVLQTEPLNFGVKHLAAGQHLFRFTAIDKNPESRGYLMGIDYILVKRAE